MKCSLCKQNIETMYLSKIRGTIITVKGKQHQICSVCQKAKGEAEIKKELS